MRLRLSTLLPALALVLAAVPVPLAAASPAGAATRPVRQYDAVTGRSLVRFGPRVDAVDALRRAGATDVAPVAPGLAVARLHGRPPATALRVEPERLRRFTQTATDPLVLQQWALPLLHADAAALHASGQGVTVAVLDSGIDGTHADLAGHVLAGVDATSPVNPAPVIPAGTDSDVAGHGTEVSGVIAAQRNNGIGIAGLAPGVNLIPVRVGDEQGVSTSAFVRGMRFAITSGAKIINLSFDGCGASKEEADAITSAVDAGLIVVAAGGNLDPSSPPGCVYPAAYPGVIAVGGTTVNDTQAPYADTGTFIDVSAPGGFGDGAVGDDVLTTTRPAPDAGCTANCYAVVAGTSFSAPYAAAVMALVWSANPSLNAAGVLDMVESTSIDLGAPGRDPVFGVGRVDAAGAVDRATGARGNTRIAGADRYETAAALSAQSYPGTAPIVYLARGDVYSPDALAAGPAAVATGGPVLLTQQCSLPAPTAAEITRLQPTSVVVLGGAQAVCDAVVAQVGALGNGPTVRRVDGADRYATAAGLAVSAFTSSPGTAYLARGDLFSPDALAGGAAAGKAKAPMLLTEQCSLPASTIQALSALSITSVVILGGSQAVCDTIVTQLQQAGMSVNRLAGTNRYETAVAVARSAFAVGATGALVARGDLYSPDALTAAPYAALKDVPLLLSGQCYAPPSTARYLNDLEPTDVWFAGGAQAVCDEAVARFL